MLSGSAPPDDDSAEGIPFPEEEALTSPHDVPLPDKNYFRIEHRGDVHEPNRWLVKFQVPPPDWPGAVQCDDAHDVGVAGRGCADEPRELG